MKNLMSCFAFARCGGPVAVASRVLFCVPGVVLSIPMTVLCGHAFALFVCARTRGLVRCILARVPVFAWYIACAT